MVAELERAGFEPDWQRVETEADYLAQLQSVPDVILADHTLPLFGAPQALQLLKEHGLDIPCIIVTGSISEEAAVERMKEGAADYILKDRMARLGPAVAHALEEKKLRADKRQAEEEVERNLSRIRALHEIALAITSTLDLRGVLDILLEKIDLVLPYSATTVRLLDRESGELEPVACRNLDENEWRAAVTKASNTLTRALLDITAPRMIRNVQADPRALAPDMLRKHGLVSALRVPLIAKGEVLGVLTFFTKEEHEFSDEEIAFLSTLAGQTAIAIENSQLYEETKKQAEELEGKNIELEKSNKVKEEFLSVMSHELRTPLNVVMGYTAMMRDGLLGEINPKQGEALAK
ncbi:MAG: GAF domain-containing protein, partial [Deltaproteobacteria bacterium]|nr:GAF domain-containing protein [Deltaproteobacteria bacterium]